MPRPGSVGSAGLALAWDGAEVLELTGDRDRARLGPTAAYDPGRRTWRRLDPAPAEVGTLGAAPVWTGHELFVLGAGWASAQGPRRCCVAGLLDPVSGRWRVTTLAPWRQTTNGDAPVAVWTGRQVVVAQAMLDGSRGVEVAGYDPASNRWARIDPPVASGHPPLAVTMVAVPEGLLLWSMWGRLEPTGPTSGPGPSPVVGYAGVDVLRRAPDGRWSDVTGSWPQNRTVEAPVFTGARILLGPSDIWCGACSHPFSAGKHADLVDPATLTVPLGASPAVWTGRALFALAADGRLVSFAAS